MDIDSFNLDLSIVTLIISLISVLISILVVIYEIHERKSQERLYLLNLYGDDTYRKDFRIILNFIKQKQKQQNKNNNNNNSGADDNNNNNNNNEINSIINNDNNNYIDDNDDKNEEEEFSNYKKGETILSNDNLNHNEMQVFKETNLINKAQFFNELISIYDSDIIIDKQDCSNGLIQFNILDSAIRRRWFYILNQFKIDSSKEITKLVTDKFWVVAYFVINTYHANKNKEHEKPIKNYIEKKYKKTIYYDNFYNINNNNNNRSTTVNIN